MLSTLTSLSLETLGIGGTVVAVVLAMLLWKLLQLAVRLAMFIAISLVAIAIIVVYMKSPPDKLPKLHKNATSNESAQNIAADRGTASDTTARAPENGSAVDDRLDSELGKLRKLQDSFRATTSP